ncbi:unnamed protein product [Adineta steineri]|uniref:G-protein coupled receptors family 1 profile domain-containing protein n=1 Tax=Adineta steineri TaxID=433720 RepID=A0A815LZ64_9BILA|nr:unnamed protein product [Adineta steineri]CAF1415247.1 unnamed protein product [Adineta steineri]
MATNRQCHTLHNCLVLNSTVAGLIINIIYMCQGIYQLSDVGDDILCRFRGLLLQMGTGLLYHTLCVQAFHRLFVTVYSTKRYFQTKSFNIYMVIIQWVISCSFGLPVFLTGQMKYYAEVRMCQVSIDETLSSIYFTLIIFVFPLLTIIFIYIHIVKYMKQNSHSTTKRLNITGHHRHHSELRLIRRILIIVIVLFLLGFPYGFLNILIEIHVMPSWPYIISIGYIFITIGQGATTLINLITTDDVRKVLINIFKKYIIRKNQVHCINAINVPNLMFVNQQC